MQSVGAAEEREGGDGRAAAAAAGGEGVEEFLWQRVRRELLPFYVEEAIECRGDPPTPRDAHRLGNTLWNGVAEACFTKDKVLPCEQWTVVETVKVVRAGYNRASDVWFRRRARILRHFVTPAMNRYFPGTTQDSDDEDAHLSNTFQDVVRRTAMEIMDDPRREGEPRDDASEAVLADLLVAGACHAVEAAVREATPGITPP